jgi:hypothetical protein
MANLGKTPGDETSTPIESRRAALGEADPGQVSPDMPAAEEPTGLPPMGELSPEAARPSPLDDIAEAERESLPRD